MKQSILIVDDNESVCYSFRRLLEGRRCDIVTAGSGAEGLLRVQEQRFDLIILDVRLPDMSGLQVLKEIKKIDPKAVVLVITAFGTTETAIEATKNGAYDYILKPFDIPAMRRLIDEALESSRVMRTEVLLSQADDLSAADRIVGSSPAMQEVYKMIGRIAGSDVNVLIRGESGTGKELAARAIYQHSRRAQKPFLTVNCAAIPETLLEAELFGHERGSFTGAERRRIGKFEQADGGTLFLDEIGDMSLTTQAKILRVVQEGTFERVGGEETLHVDTRVIAATNQNLEKAIEEGRFREDLYYRIKVVTITLPPLRERRQDIPELVNYFLLKYSMQQNKEGLSLSDEALEALLRYDWPGNVRELENLTQRAVVLCKSRVIPAELFVQEFKSDVRLLTPEFNFSSAELEAQRGRLYETVMSETERALLKAVLEKTRGNQVKAAEILGISRVTLRDRIARYGLETDL